jgi:hypothetical protein
LRWRHLGLLDQPLNLIQAKNVDRQVQLIPSHSTCQPSGMNAEVRQSPRWGNFYTMIKCVVTFHFDQETERDWHS